MSEETSTYSATNISDFPESIPHPKKRAHLSMVWVVPILAAAVGIWVAAVSIMSEGPKITITFQSADGLEAGKTKINYNGVQVGTLKTIRLSDDRESVVATAQMVAKSEDLLHTDTRFWVVRPRISGANISGLGTLISGAYVGMEIGQAKETKRSFVSLDTPPEVTSDVVGSSFVLNSPDLGSLDVGTPVFYRQLSVGEVTAYELDKSGQALNINVFVKAPYDQYVNANTRFWNISGIDLSMSANGFSFRTQSIMSVLIGGIAFETSATDAVLTPVSTNTTFKLFDDRAEAFNLLVQDPLHLELVFKDSVRGLEVGAPVEFRGIRVGTVKKISGQADPQTFDFLARVDISLDVSGFGLQNAEVEPGVGRSDMQHKILNGLVERGVRAQLRTGSLLTGALFVAFDFFPDTSPEELDWSLKSVKFPTTPGALDAMEMKISNIIDKLDRVPIEDISEDLRKAIVDINKTVESAQKLVEPNSVMNAQLSVMLQDGSRAARSFSELMDYLERHPDSLIMGKTKGAQ